MAALSRSKAENVGINMCSMAALLWEPDFTGYAVIIRSFFQSAAAQCKSPAPEWRTRRHDICCIVLWLRGCCSLCISPVHFGRYNKLLVSLSLLLKLTSAPWHIANSIAHCEIKALPLTNGKCDCSQCGLETRTCRHYCKANWTVIIDYDNSRLLHVFCYRE